MFYGGGGGRGGGGGPCRRQSVKAVEMSYFIFYPPFKLISKSNLDIICSYILLHLLQIDVLYFHSSLLCSSC